MILIDGSYLYTFGKSIQPLYNINENTTYEIAAALSFNAKRELNNFVTMSVYSNYIGLIINSANALLNCLEEIEKSGFNQGNNGTSKDKIDYFLLVSFKSLLSEFESVFKAIFQNANMFLATEKGGYDTRCLIEKGQLLFPSSLGLIVPEALADVKSATKCLAFEVYTASGFHLHRANESVVIKYYTLLTNEELSSNERNLGVYIRKLQDAGAPELVTSCLRDLKNMHRNPLMHPEQSIDNEADAIALLCAVHTSINTMLKQITEINVSTDATEH